MVPYYSLQYLFIYGFLGWCTEVVFAAVKERRFVNREEAFESISCHGIKEASGSAH